MPKSINRAALMGLALTMVAGASPIAAQQTAPQAAPASETAAPPPFPPYPKIAPREHDPNYRKTAHARSSSGSSAHHAAKTSSHAKAAHQSAKSSRHSKTSHKEKAARPARHESFSKRTIRQCHAMTYAQIMAHSNCRTMMSQDLEAKTQAAHRAKSKASSHRGAKAQHKKSSRHHR